MNVFFIITRDIDTHFTGRDNTCFTIQDEIYLNIGAPNIGNGKLHFVVVEDFSSLV